MAPLSPADIQAAHDRLGHKLGWRWLYGPSRALQGAPLAFIGLNPGGAVFHPPMYSCETGSAYVVEGWRHWPPGESPLQRQVRALFRYAGVEPDEVLAGNLVPFRSPSWAALVSKKESLAFGRELWQPVLDAPCPRLIICMSGVVERELARLLRAEGKAERVPVGWGRVTASTRELPEGRRLVRLPHLSRFRLFGRPESAEGLEMLGIRLT